MKRHLRVALVFTPLVALLPTCGCTASNHVAKLRHEIAAIREAAAEPDPTVRVLVIFLDDSPPTYALKALNEPKMLYLATFRFVLVVVGKNDVTVRYRNEARSYAIPPRLYVGLFNYIPSGQDVLGDHFVGYLYSPLWEYLVVADLALNPIDKERPVARHPYPTLITKYGTYLKEDYEAWLGSNEPPQH